jgi:hypothetical protein
LQGFAATHHEEATQAPLSQVVAVVVSMAVAERKLLQELLEEVEGVVEEQQ